MTRTRAIARRLQQLAIAVTLLVALPGAFEPVSAQIYEWVDDTGGRHFDTSLEQVPEGVRAQARIVAPAGTPSTADGASSASVPSAAAPNTGESEHADLFGSGWDTGFGAGWEAGYRAAAEQLVCPAEPEVVVLESQSPVVVNVPPYDPSGAYYRSPYDGLVTVPFDDGASRGLTRRNQIQERRAIERGW